MGSFFVGQACVNRILSFLESSRNGEPITWQKDSIEPSTKSGRALLRLNAKALASRYANIDAYPALKDANAYQYEFVPTSRIQALKSVMCLLYQCSEGRVPRCKLFKKLALLERALAVKIASDCPDFEKAIWD